MKTPQDHLPEQPAFIDVETSAGTLRLPHISRIPSRALRMARKGQNELDTFFTLIEETFPEGSPELAICDKLSTQELGEVFQNWTQGVEPGESSSSEN